MQQFEEILVARPLALTLPPRATRPAAPAAIQSSVVVPTATSHGK